MQRQIEKKNLPISWKNKTLIEDIMKEGGVHLVAFKKHGKTVAKMNLASVFMAMPNTVCLIFDTAQTWIHRFNTIAYLTIPDNAITDYVKALILETEVSYIQTETKYIIKHDLSELINNLTDNRVHVLFDIEVQDVDRIGYFIAEVINRVYQKQRIAKKYHGLQGLQYHYVFFIEESQNAFDSSSNDKRIFRRLRKQYNEARNFRISFVTSSQRLQDVSTKIRSKMNLLIGKTSLDDYDLKVRRLLRPIKQRQDVLRLPTGVFLYYNGYTTELIRFPMFRQSGKPFDYLKLLASLTPPQPKPTLWQRIVRGLRA